MQYTLFKKNTDLLILLITLLLSSQFIFSQKGLGVSFSQKKSQKSLVKQIETDKSLWPQYVKNTFGAERTPIEVKNRFVILSNKKGEVSKFSTLNMDDFKRKTLDYINTLTDFEMHIRYENLHDYKKYLPKEIAIRLNHDMIAFSKKDASKKETFKLKFGETLQFFGVVGNDIYYTNRKIQSQGFPYIAISPFDTDILYKTRHNVRDALYSSIGKHLDPIQLKNAKNQFVTVYEIEDDLLERRKSAMTYLKSPGHEHSKNLIADMDHVLPIPFKVIDSQWENNVEKISYKAYFSFSSESYIEEPEDNINEYFILKFKNRGLFKFTRFQNINKAVPYAWEAFIDFTENWELVDYNADKRGAFRLNKGNVLHFRSSDLLDSTSIYINVRRVPPKSTIKTSKNSNYQYTNTFKKNKQNDDYETIITTHKKNAHLYIWDPKQEDGDIISIVLNGKVIYEKIAVTRERKKLFFDLKIGDNILEVFAENVGSVAPNTAKVSYKGKSLVLKAKKGKSKKLKFIYMER